jgi:hypothetical protein
MSKENNNRVLSRMGARQLTQSEIERVAGAQTSSIGTLILTGNISNPDRHLDE